MPRAAKPVLAPPLARRLGRPSHARCGHVIYHLARGGEAVVHLQPAGPKLRPTTGGLAKTPWINFAILTIPVYVGGFGYLPERVEWHAQAHYWFTRRDPI